MFARANPHIPVREHAMLDVEVMQERTEARLSSDVINGTTVLGSFGWMLLLAVENLAHFPVHGAVSSADVRSGNG